MNVTVDRFTVTSGEDPAAATTVGYEAVPNGVIDVTSFLEDRPPIVVEPPEEEAEIRWGGKSYFQYDASIGDYRGVPDYDIDYGNFTGIDRLGDVTWPPDDPFKEEKQDIEVVLDLQEFERETEVVRVDGEFGAYVDIERIKKIVFELPMRQGPTGTIREYWRFTMNWGNQE